MKVDVCVPVRENVPSWWKENLNRLPVNQLLVSTTVPLGKARQELIQRVETPWLLFLDDDVLVGKDWWKTIKPFLGDPRIGAVSGREQIFGRGTLTDRVFNAWRNMQGTQSFGYGDRGTTVDTLFRTDLVRDWKPVPPTLSAFEDYELMCHVLKKGFLFIETPAPASHYNWGWRKTYGATKWTVEGIYRLEPYWKADQRTPFCPPQLLFSLLVAFPTLTARVLCGRVPWRVAAVILIQDLLLLIEFIRQAPRRGTLGNTRA